MKDLRIKELGWNESTLAEEFIRCTEDGKIVTIVPFIMDLDQLRNLIKHLLAIEKEMSHMTYIGKE